MTVNLKELIRGIQRQISLKIEKAIATVFVRAQVKEVYEENGKFYIRATSLLNNREISSTKYSGHRIGNGRGIIVFPKPGDVILALNILGEYFYLTSVYDEYTSTPDNQVLSDKNSMFIINNDFGSYICLQESNDIILKTKDGAKVRLYNDGGFKVFNKSNHGLEMDSTGNLTTRALSTSSTTSPGVWEGL